MNQDIKAKWVAALRSGDYKQGKYRLRKDGKFCCLGVLCDLAPDDVFEWGVDFDLGALTPDVQDWSGMASNYGRINDHEDLSAMNDGGSTFEQIADVIEEKF